ncbi:integrase catalytic domain-containing protein [Trichonephila clavipes]|nr:integrase catalytic domain-containing protein [Trichonephila clavipes]
MNRLIPLHDPCLITCSGLSVTGFENFYTELYPLGMARDLGSTDPQQTAYLSSFHFSLGSTTSNGKKPETETQVKEIVMSSVLNLSCSPENYATLLQTAEVQVINGCNKVMARLLFDSGSRKPFIRSVSKFKPFVSNRISEIQENTDPASWRHCSCKQNPADVLTRGLTGKELINFEKRWHGPEWLKDSENLWSKLEGFESMDSETVELKSSLIVNLTITHQRIIDPDKYSSLLKLLRITAYIFRFVNALRRKDIVKGHLAAEELSNAEIFWVKVTQNDFYTSEITCLKKAIKLYKRIRSCCA